MHMVCRLEKVYRNDCWKARAHFDFVVLVVIDAVVLWLFSFVNASQVQLYTANAKNEANGICVGRKPESVLASESEKAPVVHELSPLDQQSFCDDNGHLGLGRKIYLQPPERPRKLNCDSHTKRHASRRRADLRAFFEESPTRWAATLEPREGPKSQLNQL